MQHTLTGEDIRGMINTCYQQGFQRAIDIIENKDENPTELTIDILLKNGFKYCNKAKKNAMFYPNTKHPFVLSIDEDGSIGFYAFGWEANFVYVHQLLSALIFCGFKDLAKNFAI